MPIKEAFPEAGSDYLGGQSDGWEYKTAFSGSTVAHSYEMLKQFLLDEGYGEVPLPKSVEDLLLFRTPGKRRQFSMFDDYGYFHNPVKVFFPSGNRKSKKLILCIYNEQIEGHLLRFHGVES